MADQKDREALLRDLANRWAKRAQDYGRESKSESHSADKAAYARGLAEGFYKAAMELADVLKGTPSSAAGVGTTPSSTGAPPKSAPAQVPPVPPKPSYLTISLNEAYDILAFAGVQVRECVSNPDATFTAIFSKWENVMPHERRDKLEKADKRVVIIETGKTREGNDPYITFALKG